MEFLLQTNLSYILYTIVVMVRECEQTLGRVRVRTVVIISLQRTKG